MTENIPIIPSLDSSSRNLKEPTDIIEYILRHYFATPKNINDTHRNSEISLRFDEAHFGQDVASMEEAVERSLTMVFVKYFVEADSQSVNVDASDLGSGIFELSIGVIITVDGVPHSIESTAKINSSGVLEFTL